MFDYFFDGEGERICRCEGVGTAERLVGKQNSDIGTTAETISQDVFSHWRAHSQNNDFALPVTAYPLHIVCKGKRVGVELIYNRRQTGANKCTGLRVKGIVGNLLYIRYLFYENYVISHNQFLILTTNNRNSLFRKPRA